MAAPVMSHLICSIALVGLILVLPASFAMQRDRYTEAMAIRELTEISDYTSNTLENLFLLANSTNTEDLTITKKLLYLPLAVEGSIYVLNITSDDGQYASRVVASLKDSPEVAGTSWLVPGLKITPNSSLTIGSRTVEVGCSRESNGFYVWIKEVE